MNRVLVAIGAVLFEFESRRGVALVLFGRVARNPRLTLVGVGTTLGTFQSDNNPCTGFSHDPAAESDNFLEYHRVYLLEHHDL